MSPAPSSAANTAPRSITLKLDLYDDRDHARTARLVAERLGVPEEGVRRDLEAITHKLEGYLKRHRARRAAGARKVEPVLSAARQAAALRLLKTPDLIRQIGYLLGRAGIVGEEANRVVLFCVAASHRTAQPMHALIQGSSGSGKTRLLDVICACMPTERVKRFTRVTDNALYNQTEDYFRNVLVAIEDLDALSEEALLALRELMSRGILTSATSVKDDRGQIRGGELTVRGPVGTLACTTRGDVYEDNVSRSLVVAVDESPAQTARVIAYQNARATGREAGAYAGPDEQEATRRLLADAVRMLGPLEVVNPYADRVSLPEAAHKRRRLNELYLSFVRQVTLLNQFQRERDDRGRLIATPADLRSACAVLFEAIALKVDDLPGSLRQFFERVKAYSHARGRSEAFGRHDLAAHIPGLSRAHIAAQLTRLVELEYLTREGHANRGYRYRVSRWDDAAAVREAIRRDLDAQLDALQDEESGRQTT